MSLLEAELQYGQMRLTMRFSERWLAIGVFCLSRLASPAFVAELGALGRLAVGYAMSEAIQSMETFGDTHARFRPF